ncbi:MAG: phenylalanine--tRNA ligase subunit alpha [Thermodesulfobacteriota bacterium]
MEQRLLALEQQAGKEIAAAAGILELERLRSLYLGRKGWVTSLLKQLGKIPPQDRPRFGKIANQVKNAIENLLKEKISCLEGKTKDISVGPRLDITLPGRRVAVGRRHPISIIFNEIELIFTRLGFEIVRGPEIETDHYNFEALNIPKDHPARDMQDTFYLKDDFLLRTHTSPVQVRVMEKRKPPLAVICPGTVYRRDSDLSHTPMFHQVEGLVVDQGVTFSDLKGVLTLFVHQLFGEGTELRFRPSYFPFTEPSAEIDIRCVICRGSGCRVCSSTGWLEILGAGLVHPQVFRMLGYDPEVFTGYAFGMGVERIAMLKFGINDIRLFFENDLRFLRQFH